MPTERRNIVLNYYQCVLSGLNLDKRRQPAIVLFCQALPSAYAPVATFHQPSRRAVLPTAAQARILDVNNGYAFYKPHACIVL